MPIMEQWIWLPVVAAVALVVGVFVISQVSNLVDGIDIGIRRLLRRRRD